MYLTMGTESTLDWREHGVDVPVSAYARTDELKEVLLNVLENARHAQAKRVSITVTPRSGMNGSPRVDISVHDDGTGISPDVLPRIFEPHFSTSTSGSGLGLAISRQLVEGWGGEISVESTLGEGTTVLISLRAAATMLSPTARMRRRSMLSGYCLMMERMSSRESLAHSLLA